MHDLDEVPELLLALARFVTRLQAEISAAAAINWHTRPTRNDWSLTELVCHLRDVEQ